MSKLTRRPNSGSRSIDMSEVMASIKAGLPGAQLAYGVVQKFQGESQHYEVDSQYGQVLVTVMLSPNALMPEATPLTCVLATSAAGPGTGVWKIPAVGTEVVVAIPGGELEADPVIIACTASGTVPNGLDATTMVIVNPDGKVVVKDKGGASITLDGSVVVQDKAGSKVQLDGNGGVTIQAATGGTVQVTSDPSGRVKLGPVGTLPVLVQGTVDSLGFPVTQNPAASATIVNAG